MYILFQTTLSGKKVNVIRLSKIEITSTVFVSFIGYTSEETSGDGVEHTYEMPISVVRQDGNVTTNAHQWAVSSSGPFSGGTIVTDAAIIAAAKAKRKQEANAMRSIVIESGCRLADGVIDTDKDAIRNIMGSVQMAQITIANGGTFTVQWRYSDNTTHSKSEQEVIQMGVSLMTHINGCYQVSWNIKSAIDALNDLEAIANFDISTPYTALSTHPNHVVSGS